MGERYGVHPDSSRRSYVGPGTKLVQLDAMRRTTRDEIFTQAAQRLRSEFEELSTVPHNALKGGEAEDLVRKFLRDHLPRRFGVGSGFLIDPDDSVSRQSDVVIFDAIDCPVYRTSEDAGIFPSNNVAAVVEVKSRITKERLRSAFENIAEAKSLKKHGHIPSPFRNQTYGCIFAFDSELSLDSTLGAYSELMREFGIGHHPDLMVVLDKAVFTLAACYPGASTFVSATIIGLGESAEGSHIAASYAETREASLDYFFRLLLANIMMFRSQVDHPGFNWGATPAEGMAHIEYLMSVSNSDDPEQSKRNRKKYEREARQLLDTHRRSSDVIELPGPKRNE